MAIVNDNSSLLRAMRSSMKTRFEGVSVLIFAEPLKALEAILDSPPDVVITDDDMRCLTGVELASTLRKEMTSHCPKLILVSGGRVSRAQLTHFDGHFPRPFRFEDLAARIERLLSPRKVRPSHVRRRAVSNEPQD